MSRITDSHASSIFFDHHIAPYGISAYVLTEAGMQFVQKLFREFLDFWEWIIWQKLHTTHKQAANLSRLVRS